MKRKKASPIIERKQNEILMSVHVCSVVSDSLCIALCNHLSFISFFDVGLQLSMISLLNSNVVKCCILFFYGVLIVNEFCSFQVLCSFLITIFGGLVLSLQFMHIHISSLPQKSLL